tara:strand:- start:2434 stop:3870 length:1437 start_codon:yes stop_codon:yes gene_type:complete
MVFQNNVLSGAGGSGTTVHTIDQSIRFNDDDSPFMSRTQQAGNQTTWTISCWVKIGNMPGSFTIWSVHTAYQSFAQIKSTTGLQFVVGNGSSSNSYHNLTRVFRDPSAWYHLVMVFDSTNAASSERARIYVNGERQLDFSNTGSWAKDYASNVNSTQTMYIGEQGTGGNHMDGYIAEFVQIDGQALGPSSFGEFNSSGIWIPKDISGLTFGTNGCHIDGRDASDLGDDESGNGNDFSTSGLAAHDQVLDSPTNNFATFNPLMTTDSDFEFSEGNLKLDMNTNNSWYVGAGASMSMSSGKWYWESYWNSGDSYTIWGILDTEQLHTLAGSGSSSIYALNFNGIQPNSSGTNDQYRQGQGGSAIATGQAGAPGGIWQFALDMDNKKMWLGYNGTYVGSGDPAGGTNETWSSTYIASSSYTPINQGYQISAHSILTYNFGQDSTFAGATTAGGNSDGNGIGNFKYSVPSGFKALCTKNLGS